MNFNSLKKNAMSSFKASASTLLDIFSNFNEFIYILIIYALKILLSMLSS